MPTYKIIIIGDSQVGKTAITSRYLSNAFHYNTMTTIGIDFRIKKIVKDGVEHKMEIWDSAGQERFRTITKTFVRGAKGIVLVYDITDRSSYDKISDWIKFVDSIEISEKIFMLIGNKSDMVDKRAVSYEDGINLAHKYHISNFFETSAKDGNNIAEAFDNLFDKMISLSLITEHPVIDLPKKTEEKCQC